MSDKPILVESSARHVHLTQEDLDVLFGVGSSLTHVRDLSQPGQFICEERVELVGPKRSIANVGILGPLRAKSQVEVSLTDCFNLGVIGPVRESGDLEGSAPIKLKGPAGELELTEGLIVAKRHVHMTPADAEEYGVKDKDIVSIAVKTDRPVTFGDCVVRVSEKFALAVHLDTDEANAALVGRKGAEGFLIK